MGVKVMASDDACTRPPTQSPPSGSCMWPAVADATPEKRPEGAASGSNALHILSISSPCMNATRRLTLAATEPVDPESGRNDQLQQP